MNYAVQMYVIKRTVSSIFLSKMQDFPENNIMHLKNRDIFYVDKIRLITFISNYIINNKQLHNNMKYDTMRKLILKNIFAKYIFLEFKSRELVFYNK